MVLVCVDRSAVGDILRRKSYAGHGGRPQGGDGNGAGARAEAPVLQLREHDACLTSERIASSIACSNSEHGAIVTSMVAHWPIGSAALVGNYFGNLGYLGDTY